MGALVCWCNIKQNLMCIPRECQAPPLPGLHTTNTKDMGTIGLSFCLCSQYRSWLHEENFKGTEEKLKGMVRQDNPKGLT